MKSCILKGQGVAKLYKIRNEELEVRNGVNLGLYRQSGDIDVWVDKVRDDVIDFVMQNAPTREFDQKHIHFHVFEDVDVEMHWIPVNMESPRFNRILGEYFRKESSRQFANSSCKVCYPTVDFQLVLLLIIKVSAEHFRCVESVTRSSKSSATAAARESLVIGVVGIGENHDFRVVFK